ncbi:Heavy-metal-associated domain-containing protein [Anaerovirgula multivorans]|uniref:Copper chaperone CopZ n=1 Tax=Anaerovirgula multivorans TaxID=312168 RepID=A0A239DGH6_9FIRM|nr:cation transporter [Anaerovirgula multivorans]SNS31470.1 Heavy-metal-associated domain-containing protein [Anaerovirgula multivorans]
MREIVIRINGIECSSCVIRLKNALGALEGVERAEINSVTAQSYIIYNENILSVDDIECCIRKSGYQVPMMTAEIAVSNMYKKQEVQIQDCLKAINGVKEVKCDIENDQVNISYWAVGIRSKDFIDALAGNGLDGTVIEVNGGEEEQIYRERLFHLRLLIESAFLTMPLLWNPSPLIQLLIATLIQLGPGRFFYKGAWKSIRNRNFTMDFLIAVSTTIIYGYSTYIVFTVHDDIQLYFLGDGVLMSIILLGKYLEILEICLREKVR